MKELPKAYEPTQYEDDIYRRWEESGFFNPDNLDGEPYSIMMPPPNVTGVLHLGHAMENSLMDLMARFQRMRGKKVLLLPGTDHAAVATQARVEKNEVEKGVENPREHYGREKLLEIIRTYAEESKATILSQIRKMGTSADWSRLAYTFDEQRSETVNEVFTRMYNDGLIYRGHRVINWSVKGQSTCSDDELVHVDRKGMLYTFTYGPEVPIPIATTRPETKLGDTAIAVNPEDDRYKQYIGKTFETTFCGNTLKLKVIGDPHVDASYGTGALGVTPAHSAIDFEMYERKKAEGDPIELIQVIGADGRMTAQAGDAFAGLTVGEARAKVVEQLRAADLLQSEEEIDQSVGTSDRFGDIVEAIPMTQWFVAVNKEIPGRGKSLKQLMHEAVSAGHNGDAAQQITITPDRFVKTYFSWIDNLRDWCISRQIWWGHRIPVYYRKQGSLKSQVSSLKEEGDEVHIGTEPPSGDGWEQDPDTLDTWFSSGLWTFSTLESAEDQKTYHPTNWMQMGYEILFFWMARMILMSTYVRDEIPFRDVYIHGMLRDKHGRKFSKSLGNGIDPLEVIEKHGADALRWSVIGGISPGNDSKFYLEKVEGAQHFVNKLWNISRFILMNIETPVVDAPRPEPKTLADKWILSKLDQIVQQVTTDLEQYRFSSAGEQLRDFTWNELADWYLEVAKIEGDKSAMLNYVLNTVLKLWHPYMPFVTETIWQQVYGEEQMLMVAPWPASEQSAQVTDFETLQNIISGIRSLRSAYSIPPPKELDLYIGESAVVTDSSGVVQKLARVGSIRPVTEKPEGAVGFSESGVEVYLDFAGLVDFEQEKVRLQKEIGEVEPYIQSQTKKLSNKKFVSGAPAEVVEAEKEKLADAEARLATLQNQLSQIS